MSRFLCTHAAQKQLKGTIDLRLGGEIRRSDTHELTFLIKPNGDYRTWQLRATNERELEGWIQNIQEVMEQNNARQMVKVAGEVKDAERTHTR